MKHDTHNRVSTLQTTRVFYSVSNQHGSPVWSRLWTKVHDVLGWCRRSLWLSMHLTDCLYRVSFQRYRPLKLPLSCEVVQKGGLGPPICTRRGYPRFWTSVFKSQLLPSTWPILVEFRSASSEIRRRKKQERKKKEPVVKRKSAERYVGRPKIHFTKAVRQLLLLINSSNDFETCLLCRIYMQFFDGGVADATSTTSRCFFNDVGHNVGLQ